MKSKHLAYAAVSIHRLYFLTKFQLFLKGQYLRPDDIAMIEVNLTVFKN